MKPSIAPAPPMGWNSWDSYGMSVNEEEVRANAVYMAEHLKEHGWEYVVIDAQWYNPRAVSSKNDPNDRFELDEFGRFMPARNRFPSSIGGKGFKPLADELHSLGLKLGLHLMRGIPRQAVAEKLPVLGTERNAADIAELDDVCSWNEDMYGIDPTKDGAADYYRSVFRLLAEWEIDFVKIDDIANPYSAEEIEMVSEAIRDCGRPMVLSVSPGPAPIEQAGHLRKHAHMCRISMDFWDVWDHLRRAFDLCKQWEGVGEPGFWPDADMLPIGRIGIRSFEYQVGERHSRFTWDEQQTLMALWCMFKSPLFIGGDMCRLDPWTYSLVTNKELLKLHRLSSGGRERYRDDDVICWTATGGDRGETYIAVFNVGNEQPNRRVPLDLAKLGVAIPYHALDVFKGEKLDIGSSFELDVPSHGCRLLKLISHLEAIENEEF